MGGISHGYQVRRAWESGSLGVRDRLRIAKQDIAMTFCRNLSFVAFAGETFAYFSRYCTIDDAFAAKHNRPP